jgi:hypothetical protein
MPIDVTQRRPRYKSNWLPYTTAAAYRSVRTSIEQELKARYEVPRDLPHEMTTLLTLLNRAHPKR